jgi:hypothetical protein
MLTSPRRTSQQHHSRIGDLSLVNERHQLVGAAGPSEKSDTIGGLERGKSLIGTSTARDLR